jgi:phage terminase small subunit
MTAEKAAAKAADSASAAAPSAGNAAVPLSNAKHEAVLQAYVADPARVGWRAYSKVYPESSEGAAKTAFSRLLKKADFAGRLQFLTAAITERVVESSAITIEKVIGELAKVGFANVEDYIHVTADGDPRIALEKMDRSQAAAVQSVTVEDYVDGRGDDARDVRKVSFRLHPKIPALVAIGEHLGAFVKKHEHTGKDGAPIAVEDKTERSDLDVARRIAFVLAKAARATIAGGGENPEGGDG